MLSLDRLAEIERDAVACIGEKWISADPATLAALCRVARAAMDLNQYGLDGGPRFTDWDKQYDALSDALRAAGLIEP